MEQYYNTLGIPFGSPLDVVKAAWRILVKDLHPDVRNGDVSGEQKLKEVNVAYHALAEHLQITEGHSETGKSSHAKNESSERGHEKIFVDSTAFEFISYDSSLKVLEVKFRTGGSYHYLEVPFEVWIAFKNASSKGRFWHTSITGTYRERHA